MGYLFTEPVSFGTLSLFFLLFLIVLIYIVYFYTRRRIILKFKREPTAFIVGVPNSGRTFIMKALSKSNISFFNKLLGVSYIDLIYDGKTKLKIVDHHELFDMDGRFHESALNEIGNMDPKCIVIVLDVSQFSAPIENQIQFVMKMKEVTKNKKIFVIANKLDKTSNEKVKVIEKFFGKAIYKVRFNKPEDSKKLRTDLTSYFVKKT